MDLETLFEKYEDEYLEFDRVESKRHPRPDIHAFLLLSELVPEDGCDIVSSAVHDKIWLSTECEDLAAVATEEQIIELIRCGVGYDEDSLYMFV